MSVFVSVLNYLIIYVSIIILVGTVRIELLLYIINSSCVYQLFAVVGGLDIFIVLADAVSDICCGMNTMSDLVNVYE